MKLVEIIKNIQKVVGNRDIIIFGGGLTKLITGKRKKHLNIFVPIHNNEDVKELQIQMPYLSSVTYYFAHKFDDIEKSSITINNFYIYANDLLSHSNEPIENYIKFHYNASLKDLQRKIINFTKFAKENFKPEYIFEAIYESAEYNYLIHPKSLDIIIEKRNILSSLYKRDIYHKILYLFSSSKPHKCIKIMNILGISDVLFNCKLNDHLSYSPLHKSDIPEFFFLLGNFSNETEYKDFLVNKCGVFEKELDLYFNIYNAFKSIDIMKDDLTNTKIIYPLLNEYRVLNFCRLLNVVKLNSLSKMLKTYYYHIQDKKKGKKLIWFKPIHIKKYFGIDNKQKIDILYKEAMEKINNDPSFYDITQVLNFLKERIYAYDQSSNHQ